MIRNIRHIQIEKIAYHPNLFKAILTFERPNIIYDESDDIDYIKSKDVEDKLTNKKEVVKSKFG